MTESDLGKLNKVWSQLESWDDPRQSLQILSTRFTLTTLSNGSMASVISSGKMAKLPFDFILTGVLVESAKPDTKVYPFACEILGLRSCYLCAAAKVGSQVAYVHRPKEYGYSTIADKDDSEFEFELEFESLSRWAAYLMDVTR